MPPIPFFTKLIDQFFLPEKVQRKKYRSFKRLLEEDHRCHELIAEAQEYYAQKEPVEWVVIVTLYTQLHFAIKTMVAELANLSPQDARNLGLYLKKLDSFIKFFVHTEPGSSSPPYLLWLNNQHITAQNAGNKARNLSEISQKTECVVPEGFVITTNCWNALIRFNDLRSTIDKYLMQLNPQDIQSLHSTSKALMALILRAELPPESEEIISQAVTQLTVKSEGSAAPLFAVRSSAVSEDGHHSFAGQYLSLLNVSPAEILESYLKVLASRYTPQALLYRIATGIRDDEAPMAVLVIEMVEAEVSGVTYTTDPHGEEKDILFLRSVKGSGEKLVSGRAQAHLHCFPKDGNPPNFLPVESGSPVKSSDAVKLARLAMELEDLFGCPQDIEWAIDRNGPVILQSRPLATIQKCTNTNTRTPNAPHKGLPEKKRAILYQGGISASPGRGSGQVVFFSSLDETIQIPEKAILVVEDTPASLIVRIQKCDAVVTVQGSIASHFATICRELGVPLLVGASNVFEKLTEDSIITVDADRQTIYAGADHRAASDAVQTGSNKNRHPYYRRLRTILDFIVPLHILDPEDTRFVPESCQSFHDIVRFSHERAVQAMFALSQSRGRQSQRQKLTTTLPFNLYLLQADIIHSTQTKQEITVGEVSSTPFQALWRGLSHHSVPWQDGNYYNWKEYDRAAMTDAFVFENKSDSDSFALYGDDYLNLNIRFGYHFAVVDTLCGKIREQNYCTIRFAGGGGTPGGQFYRLLYLEKILRRLDFQINRKTDLLQAKLESVSADQQLERLFEVGRMLGISKQMDLVLTDENAVAYHLDQFFTSSESMAEYKG